MRVAEIVPMGECAECRQLKTELEKGALEYLRVTSFTDKDDKRNKAARETVAEAQKPKAFPAYALISPYQI